MQNCLVSHKSPTRASSSRCVAPASHTACSRESEPSSAAIRHALPWSYARRERALQLRGSSPAQTRVNTRHWLSSSQYGCLPVSTSSTLIPSAYVSLKGVAPCAGRAHVARRPRRRLVDVAHLVHCPAQQDVRRLDVTVHHAHGVQPNQRLQDLHGEAGDVLPATVLLAGNERGHAHPPGLHDDRDLVRIAAKAVQVVAHDMRVSKLLQLREPGCHQAPLILGPRTLKTLHRQQHHAGVCPVEHGGLSQLLGHSNARWKEVAHARAALTRLAQVGYEIPVPRNCIF